MSKIRDDLCDFAFNPDQTGKTFERVARRGNCIQRRLRIPVNRHH
jgi:hypothetical protein